jgi:MerR family transcriptional regulator, light-induced transcriptional regulator
MSKSGYPIKIAARRSGLSAHVIRAWEKRYGAVKPGRSDTRRRLYSDEEIGRLALLSRATQAGHSIGNIAHFPDEELRKLAAEAPPEPTPARPASPSLAPTVERAFQSVNALDGAELERLLRESLVTHGRAPVMRDLLVPLIHRIGDAWQNGELRIAHEHVASAVIRTFLGNFVRPHSETSGAPVLVVGTPGGQLHELGALLAAAAASEQGWRVTFLGPSLPPEEIAGAARQNNARAVALSIVYPDDDDALPQQLHSLRQLLPARTPILVGGRAAASYTAALGEISAVLCSSLEEFVRELEQARKRRS